MIIDGGTGWLMVDGNDAWWMVMKVMEDGDVDG